MLVPENELSQVFIPAGPPGLNSSEAGKSILIEKQATGLGDRDVRGIGGGWVEDDLGGGDEASETENLTQVEGGDEYRGRGQDEGRPREGMEANKIGDVRCFGIQNVAEAAGEIDDAGNEDSSQKASKMKICKVCTKEISSANFKGEVHQKYKFVSKLMFLKGQYHLMNKNCQHPL